MGKSLTIHTVTLMQHTCNTHIQDYTHEYTHTHSDVTHTAEQLFSWTIKGKCAVHPFFSNRDAMSPKSILFFQLFYLKLHFSFYIPTQVSPPTLFPPP